jgi:hypothetical protein
VTDELARQILVGSSPECLRWSSWDTYLSRCVGNVRSIRIRESDYAINRFAVLLNGLENRISQVFLGRIGQSSRYEGFTPMSILGFFEPMNAVVKNNKLDAQRLRCEI